MIDKRGSIAVMTALLLLPLIAAVGLAVDGARAWLVSSRLQGAVDAATLAGARNLYATRAVRDAEIRALYWGNLDAATPDPLNPNRRIGFLGASAETPIITDNTDNPTLPGVSIVVTGHAVVPTTFMRVFGINTVAVSATAQAQRADVGMEIALVLDVTGSMGANYRGNSAHETDFNTTPNIHALRVAAQDLVNILFGNRRFVDGLWVSVVPYTTTVNVGNGQGGLGRRGIDRSQGPNRIVNLDLLQPSTTDGRHSWGLGGAAAYGPAGWGGCIEARPNDRSPAEYEAPPGPNGLRPFFYPSTLRFVPPTSIPANPLEHVETLMRRDAEGRLLPGDNDWIPVMATIGPVQSPFAITEQWRTWRENFAVGPNLGCPPDEVLPLTADRDVILQHVANLRSSFRGGTMTNIGLQAGWWTISPLWREVWDLGPPPPGRETSLPLDYGAPFMRKVVVLMTDGINGWFDYPGGWPGDCSTGRNNNRRTFPWLPTTNVPVAQPEPCPPGHRTQDLPVSERDADYTGYGRLRDGALGTVTNVTAALNARMLEQCAALKEAGVIIYTVTFNLNSIPTQNLFRQCATSPDYYFNSPTQEDLRAAFQQIGSQLANLRLTR